MTATSQMYAINSLVEAVAFLAHADPFPYDLSEDELKKEVRYSLGIESL